MKKRAKLVVMVLGIALAIAGCGQDKSSTAQSETVTQVSTQGSTQGSTGETTQETKESKAETESVKETAVNTGSEASSEAAKETGNGEQSDSAGASEDEGKLLEQAKAFANDIVAGDYEKIKSDYQFEDQLKEVLGNGQLEQSLAPAIAASGKLNEMKEAWVSSRSQYTNVEVPCDFETQPWNMVISFNKEGKIGGIHTGEYKEASEETSMPEGVKETAMNLKVKDGWELPGIFTQPENKTEYAAVVFVHGSGSSDKDESLGQLKPFRDLAWGLAQKGVASYRYDKISYVYGKELAADPDFTVYDETVNDAVAAVKMLREQKGITKVYVVGHSQGGQMMPAIAEAASPDGCIMMAAPARGFAETIERQCKYLQSLEKNPTEEVTKSYENMFKEIDKMKNIDSLGADEKIMGQSVKYMKSIFDFDSVKEAEKMTMPVLVLQGEEDYQVTMDDFKIWEEHFKEKANWEFQSFPGLTHVFMPGKYEDGAANYQGEKHIPEEVMASIATFVEK
ncbi:alpha/beta hydrolase [Robinsoniella sp. KNHs210]|uniref:alpha/beta hydrolase n=1 Tax=Robinsoniella sp. KNHs210 TaxID=1469950 RepID=UPI0004884152|nr:alpha/beta fold hydrolase [Robinsoniella sp. KNHs210]